MCIRDRVGVATFVSSLGTSGPASLALIAAGTALSAGSTIASAVAIANNDEEAAKWGQYLGYAAMAASVPLIAQSAFKGVKHIGKPASAAGRNTSIASVPIPRFTNKGVATQVFRARGTSADFAVKIPRAELRKIPALVRVARAANADSVDWSAFVPARPFSSTNFIKDRLITSPHSPKPSVTALSAAGPNTAPPGATPGAGGSGPIPAQLGDRNWHLLEVKMKVHPQRID